MPRGRDILKKEASQLLISKLRALQKRQGYLNEENLKKLSLQTGIPLTKIYEVATFYSFFNLEKKGKHIIMLCNSPACNLNGSEDILKIIRNKLKIRAGETTKDRKFTLELTSCIGCCDESPAMLLDGKAHTKLDEKKILAILKKCR